MNGDTFDRLSKHLAGTTSRRGLLKAFVAGMGAALFGSIRSSSPKAEAFFRSPPLLSPGTFLKGVGYAESFPPVSPGTGMPGYNPSTANGNASASCATDGSGHYEFFGSDEARAESAPMWGTTYAYSGGTVTGRDDIGAIAGMGANLIRMYDWDARNNHLPFLDHCHAKNVKVLVPIVNCYLNGNPNCPPTPANMQALVKSFGNAAGNDYHPAVAGIIIGNEPRLNGYGAAQAINVTNLYVLAESAVGFPSRPFIGHPVDFATYGGQYPCWGFWNTLVPGLTGIKSRLFLAPQSYNDAAYLFTNAEGSGQGYVPLTYDQYQLPILFTEMGQDRTKPNYQTVVRDQLTGCINYAAENPSRLLGTAFFQFADKGWLCPTPDSSCPSEGQFGAYSHSATAFATVAYTAADFTHFDFVTACPSQSIVFDRLTPSTLYSVVQAAYTGSSSCGAAQQPCCANNTCNAGLVCLDGKCTPASACGGDSQPCCAPGNTCNAGLTCSDGKCTATRACGGDSQPCCSPGDTCNTGLTCSSGTCRPGSTCGGYQQQCCAGNTCISAGLTCSAGTCQLNGTCGSPTATCCSSGPACLDPNTICRDNACKYCGYPTQPCCAGNTCKAGTCSGGTCSS